MALLLSRATGNFTTNTTWGVVDATSLNNTETTTTALTTAFQESTGSTPGAITVDGVAVKLSVRTGTTGTMSVHLAVATVEVTGTLVTINTADLPVAATADLNGGWIFFKFAAPVLLLAATSYTVGAKTSSAAQVSLFSTATTNWARALVTTTNAAPGAGDDMIVVGEYTGAGTSNTFTVTYNQTVTTDYGANPTAATSLIQPGLAIGSKGILRNGVVAATAYNLKMSNSIILYSGGEWDIGTVGTEIPRDSSMTVLIDCPANVQFGITVRNLGTFKTQGLSRTIAKVIDRCKLNTDEAVNSTSLGVDTDTGWLDNDEIAVASTTRTVAQSEKGTLNGAAGASTLTVDGFAGAGGGLAFAHSGTSPVFAEVILLTRNVRLSGASNSLQTYILIQPTATVDCRWTEFFFIGSGTANNRGIDLNTTTGSTSFDYCSFHDFIVASSRGFNIGSVGTENNYALSNIVMFNVEDRQFIQGTATSGTNYSLTNWCCLRAIGSQAAINWVSAGGTFTSLTVVGGSNAFLFSTSSSTVLTGTYSDWYARCCSASGISLNAFSGGTFTNMTAARGNSSGIFITGVRDTILTNPVQFGNTTQNMSWTGGIYNVVFNGGSSSGDTSFATTNGLTLSSTTSVDITFNNYSFGVASGAFTAHTNDINVSINNNPTQIRLNNSFLSSATQVATPSALSPAAYIKAERLQQTDNNHKTWKRYGTITVDTTIFNTATPSQRATPTNASFKLNSGSFKVNVNDGQTVTPSVYARKSVVGDGAAYNGNQPRLIVLRNEAMGITTDTVLDTMTVAAGNWEQLTGTTIAVIDNGVLEFAVDCDGTAGWINVDDASATVT